MVLCWYFVSISCILLVGVFVQENDVKHRKWEQNALSALSWWARCQHDGHHDVSWERSSKLQDKKSMERGSIGWRVGRNLDDAHYPPLTYDRRFVITMMHVIVLMSSFLATFSDSAKGVFHHYLWFLLHDLWHSIGIGALSLVLVIKVFRIYF